MEFGLNLLKSTIRLQFKGNVFFNEIPFPFMFFNVQKTFLECLTSNGKIILKSSSVKIVSITNVFSKFMKEKEISFSYESVYKLYQ